MKSILRFLRRSLELTINEAKAAFLLALIIIVSLLLTFFYSKYSGNQQSQLVIKEYGDTPIIEKEEFEFKKNYKEYKNYDRYEKSYNKGSKTKIRRFDFDPNIASEEELLELGMPKYVTKIILNYRSKGGKFKSKEDLLKIYGMKPELYESLSGYIVLPAKTQTLKSDFEESNIIKEPAPTFAKKTYPVVEKTTERFDINLADTSQLIGLKGVGKVFANRIVKYRDMLGGFSNVDQVAETYGLEPTVMEEIKKRTFIKIPVKKIKINQATTIKHPYLKFFHVKAILAYKLQHGNFLNIEDIKKIKAIDEQTINKIEPYLDFN
jgi:competence protein ComEA